MNQRPYRLREYLPLLLVIISFLLQPFFNPALNVSGNFFNVLKQSSYTGIMAIGMLFVLIGGDVNLSIGSQFAFYGVLSSYLMTRLKMPILPAISVTLLAAILMGLLTGYLIERFHLNSMISTIALAVTVEGLTFGLTGGVPIFNLPREFIRLNLLGQSDISLSIIILVLLGLLAGFILHRTYFGIHLYAVGSDQAAARRMGISVLATKMVAYALCSLATAISAIAYIGWIGTAPLTISFNAELDVLTAAALAGVGFSGGRGSVAPTVFGAIFLGVVSVLLISLNIGPYYQNIIKGAILFAALLTKSTKS